MNRSKAKGTRFEVEIRDYLQSHWPDVERLPTEGANDRGDVLLPAASLELKNQVKMNLAGWMKEAEKEWKHSGKRFFALVHKRSYKPVEESYVTMPLWMYVETLYAATSHASPDAHEHPSPSSHE